MKPLWEIIQRAIVLSLQVELCVYDLCSRRTCFFRRCTKPHFCFIIKSAVVPDIRGLRAAPHPPKLNQAQRNADKTVTSVRLRTLLF